MKEVLRLVDAEQQGSYSGALRKYNLEIFAEEIVVVFGLAGSGLRGLLRLMDGSDGLSNGRIYIHEERAPSRRDDGALWKKIYICGDIHKQFKNLSVAENLDLLSQKYPLLHRYDRKRVLERARRYLRAEGVAIDPEVKLSALSYSDRLCLNLLQAKMAHASLVVLDSTEFIVNSEGTGAAERMIRRFKKEGMSFLLLSYREDVYYGLATRMQKISYGADIMEWRPPFSARIQNSLAKYTAPEPIAGMDGIWDEWINHAELHQYLTVLRQENPTYWDRELDLSIPPAQMCTDGKTVLIPRDSAWRLLKNLSVKENVILPIPGRVSRGASAYIPARVAENAATEFYRVTGIAPDKQSIGQLSLVERKLLSLYRWEQARPEVMVLQNPHFGMDLLESRQLDDYLRHLARRGIHVYLLSGSIDNLKHLCSRVTAANSGKCAHLYTDSGA